MSCLGLSTADTNYTLSCLSCHKAQLCSAAFVSASHPNQRQKAAKMTIDTEKDTILKMIDSGLLFVLPVAIADNTLWLFKLGEKQETKAIQKNESDALPEALLLGYSSGG